jgi:8-oxo-dGTP pyrophosphatase MutT (NUDIX family)
MWHQPAFLQSADFATPLSLHRRTLYRNAMRPDLQRHIDACNTARLPGTRLPFHLGAHHVGYVTPEFAEVLHSLAEITRTPAGITLREPNSLALLARDAAEPGGYPIRGEEFDVRASTDGESLATIDRGALPSFGLIAEGVHLNGLVQRADGLHLWVARRAATKLLDPGKLDHLAAGGISAGMGAFDTLVKEAAEEAAIPAELMQHARRVAQISYAMERPEGLRRDRLQCYDLVLPEDFMPRAEDGEVESFELWPIARAVESVARTDDFKFNVSLVLVDLFQRLGLA